MNQILYDTIESNPIIAAVKDKKGLEDACKIPDIKIIFVLFGDICTINDITETIKTAGKFALVHVDLITGLSARDIAVDFVKNNTRADGIITTKPALISRGKELGLFTVLRYFLLDSMTMETIRQQESHSVHPDFIEILPGIMPAITKKICRIVKTPVIAGGLIATKEDVVGALSAGAIAVSSTNEGVWQLV
jgi:glycerol uptake operon antiterminator